jgi:hypothetical protein
MKKRKRISMVFVFLVLLVAAALSGGCGKSDSGKIGPATASVLSAATPTAGLNRCVSCHTTVTADWLTSKHANLDPAGNLYSAGVPTVDQIGGCTTNCHDPNGDSSNLTPGYIGADGIQRPVIGCESCHGPGSLHADAGGAGPISLLSNTMGTTFGTETVSGQFAMCTNCHELLDASTGALRTSPTHSTGAPPPAGDQYVITDTHFATSGDFTGSFDGATAQNTRNITGYAMDYSSETVCTNCHNPHRTAEINREWALSAHADKTTNNDEFPATKDPLGYFSGAWAHYNWGNAASYKACQRCHTTTGFSIYADALRAGNTQLALDIQHGLVTLLTSSPTASFKPEMLKCNGCHTDNRGTLRSPGAVTANYDFPIPIAAGGKPYALASHAYPDVNGSNVCMACHTGRESGDTIKGLNDPARVNIALQSAGTNSFFDFSTQGFINSHYLTAGGTVFTATGFEFAGRSYENLATYRHVDIGSSAVPNTGSNGPCIGCHMSRPGKSGDHLFMPVTRSTDTATAGNIDGIASEVCIYCHTVSGAGGLEDLINERKEEYHEAVEATIYVLDKLGFYFRPANPYFFKLRTPNAPAQVSVAKGSTTVTATVGAPLWSSGTSTVYTGTNVTGTTNAADYFKVNTDGHYYRIEDATDTTLELREPYAGPTVTDAEFTIIQGRSGGTKGWLTKFGQGVVPATADDTDKTGNTTGRYNMGAAFNLNLLEHDPGGYVHNRIYAKRLLYDSIDWADDNNMNYSVGETLNAIDGTLYTWKTGAMKYLLPNGVLGISAERP